jgi:membrane protein YdbS with pleckstrin-like domain
MKRNLSGIAAMILFVISLITFAKTIFFAIDGNYAASITSLLLTIVVAVWTVKIGHKNLESVVYLQILGCWEEKKVLILLSY